MANENKSLQVSKHKYGQQGDQILTNNRDQTNPFINVSML